MFWYLKFSRVSKSSILAFDHVDSALDMDNRLFGFELGAKLACIKEPIGRSETGNESRAGSSVFVRCASMRMVCATALDFRMMTSADLNFKQLLKNHDELTVSAVVIWDMIRIFATLG